MPSGAAHFLRLDIHHSRARQLIRLVRVPITFPGIDAMPHHYLTTCSPCATGDADNFTTAHWMCPTRIKQDLRAI
eukprot:2289377-Amphidinium_carterae.1